MIDVLYDYEIQFISTDLNSMITYVLFDAETIFTRRILSGFIFNRAAKFETRFVVKNAAGLIGGNPNDNTNNGAIFISIVLLPSIKKYAI